FTEVEDLADVGVVQLNRDLRLVDEHGDEFFIFGDVRQDALDGEQALEALDAERLGLEYLGHAADVDAVEQVVFPELDRLLQRALPSRHGPVTSSITPKFALAQSIGGR